MSLSEKLIAAAKGGNAREVRKLLGRGALFTKDKFGNTALHEAAWNGSNDIVKVLLGAFCFVDSISHTGFTPLHLASQNGHAKVVKTLLKWKADPTLLNQHGETALHLVAKYNHANVVAAFSSYKVDMNIKGKDGNTALHIAAKLGNTETIKALLHAGADPHRMNTKGTRAVDYAEISNYKEAVKMLTSASQKTKSRQRSSTVAGGRPPMKLPVDARGRSHTPPEVQHDPRSLRSMSVTNKLPLSPLSPKGDHFPSPTDKRSHLSSKSPKDHAFSALKKKKSAQAQRDRIQKSLSPALSSDKLNGSRDNLDQQPHYITMSPAMNGAPRCISIDQMLNEIEKEFNGPGYKYVPQHEETLSPYAEFDSLAPPPPIGTSLTRPPIPAKSFLKSTRSGHTTMENYDILEPPGPVDNYDKLHPLAVVAHMPPPAVVGRSPPRDQSPGSPRPSSSRQPPPLSPARQSSSPALLRSPVAKEASPLADTKMSKSRQTYESLMPKELVEGGDEGAYEDTYVYMAPLKDFPEMLSSQELSSATEDGYSEVGLLDTCSSLDSSFNSTASAGKCGSRNFKRAVICSSPLAADERHEPNSSKEPVKGILSPPSEETSKSQLEAYMQEELETMRKAFQIRLGQLEKRYQRKLVLEQRKNVAQQATATTASTPGKKENPLFQNSSTNRRNSWHSYMPSDQEMDELTQQVDRSGSSLGFDSDFSIDESDYEPDEQSDAESRSSCSELISSDQVIYATPNKPKEGLKGGARTWKEEEEEDDGARADESSPRLSPALYEDEQDTSDISLTEDSKLIIEQKIRDYRAKMMQYFKEKSEARVASIEQHYQKQMSEVERMYHVRAYEKVAHLQTRIKHLETRYEVQTLV